MSTLTTDEMAVLAMSAMTFDQASEKVLDYLNQLLPLNFWSVTEYDRDGDRQVYLHVRDQQGKYGDGDFIAWSESFCQHMVTGAAPMVAPDAMAVPQYAAVERAHHLDIGAYVGVPIQAGNGTLFGTLCGTDPEIYPAHLLEQHAPLLGLLASLLGQILLGHRLQAEAEARAATLRWRAFHDELTGLPNRALFNDRLAHALDLHQRDHRPLAVLTLDVDDFKAVNDTFGHAGGDELLVRLAERLRGVVRSGDTLARLGGDEFAVLLEQGSFEQQPGPPTAVADRMLEALGEPFLLHGQRVDVGLSVGVAALDAETGAASAAALLTHADVALYAAKRSGKSRAATYDAEMQLPEARDLRMREPLRAAIAGRQVQAYYEPVVALDTLLIDGLDCLARWSHEGTPVDPEFFIPLAARSNLLPALTASMVEQTCSQLRRWQDQGHHRLRVAVDVPPGLLTDRTFPARIAAQVRQARLHPRSLVLEITEEALVGDLETAQTVAEQLHDAGFQLALDDFGTGYSSLLHLRSVPLDAVKIDRGFVADVDTNPRTQRFLQALLALGHDLGLRVVVEGVERESQAEVLRDLGATYAQGQLFARPLPADEVDLSAA
ncbi:EAL domain-containing protein [uncultured Friedmanniella sp.]|uniref:bifunctional diguanylate cyclase/phosphodiesterase n=1 Tax=uncultured Friedmanniella sp. TaxID=335381 RepID=UPI0035CB890E